MLLAEPPKAIHLAYEKDKSQPTKADYQCQS